MKLKVVTSKQEYIFFPGNYCLYTVQKKEYLRSVENKEAHCLERADHSSFSFAQGIFIPIKAYKFNSIGYYNIELDWKPEYYFLSNPTLENMSFFGMALFGITWIILFFNYFKK